MADRIELRGLTVRGRHGFFASMIVSRINPHRFSLTGPFKSTLAVKIERAPVGNQHLLVKAVISLHEAPHDFATDTTSLIFWMYD